MKRFIPAALVLLVAGLATAGLLRAGEARRPLDPKAAPVVDVRPDAVVAFINGKSISMAELQRPLVESHGLEVLLFMVQLNLAKQKAEEQHVTYTDADVAAELDRTMKVGFQDAPKEDYPALLNQLLQKQGMSRAEFDMVIQTNAILRKIAEPQVAEQMKTQMTDEKLKEVFDAVYGQQAIIRHIQVSNPQQAQYAKQRLAAGEKFESIVETMSTNDRTRGMRGELPAFSRQTDNWGPGKGKVPQAFKDWAFSTSTKEGDVSDPIGSEGGFHILKLERRIEPKVVKFEDVKESLKADLHARAVEQGISTLRAQLGQMARAALKIEDPVLKGQYEAKLDAQTKMATDEANARKDLAGKTRPATEPTIRQPIDPLAPGAVRPAPQTLPGTPPAANATGPASPTNASTGERPPATKSAAPTPAADKK